MNDLFLEEIMDRWVAALGDTLEKLAAATRFKWGDIVATQPVSSSSPDLCSAAGPSNHLVTGKLVVLDRVPARAIELRAVLECPCFVDLLVWLFTLSNPLLLLMSLTEPSVSSTKSLAWVPSSFYSLLSPRVTYICYRFVTLRPMVELPIELESWNRYALDLFVIAPPSFILPKPRVFSALYLGDNGSRGTCCCGTLFLAMFIAELSILDGIKLIPVWLGAPTRPPRDGDVGDKTC